MLSESQLTTVLTLSMTRILLFLLTFSIIACGQDKVKENTTPPSRETNEVDQPTEHIGVEPKKETSTSQIDEQFRFNFKKWEPSFFYQNRVTSFNLDSISNFTEQIPYVIADTLNSKIVPVIGALFTQIENDSTSRCWNNGTHEGTGYLYSIQERDDHIGIVVFQMNGAWVNEMKYLSYDHQGIKIDEAIFAAKGGDGGYHSYGSGEFINDSTYIYNFKETESNFETNEEELLEEFTQRITIHRSGKIDSKIIKGARTKY